jgi:hypothetical protein
MLVNQAFIPAAEAGGGVIGVSGDGLSIAGYLGPPESVNGKPLQVGTGGGVYANISTSADCARRRGR